MTARDANWNLSRLIAGFRFVMALMFGLWIWIDPNQPAREASSGYSLFIAYLVFATMLIPVAWRDWWMDFRFQTFTLIVDCTVFVVAVYFTETGAGDFTSPYFAFFAYLVLRARMRWSWGRTALLAAALIGSYLLAGLLLRSSGIDIDTIKFVRRVSYMGLLSILLTWLIAGRLAYTLPRLSIRPDAAAFPYSAAIDYAMSVTGAKGGALLWSPDEEPRADLQFGGELGSQARKLPPIGAAQSVVPAAFVFDRERQCYLVKLEDRPVEARRGLPLARIAEECDVPEGLLVRFRGSTGTGELLLSGVPAMSGDSLVAAHAIAREIEIALAEAEIAMIAHDVSVSRVRNALARDLHDSIAQSLAGARFALHGIIRRIATDADPATELAKIDGNLAAEQAQVRLLIERLRREDVTAGDCDAHAELEALVEVLQQQWPVEIFLGPRTGGVIVPRILMFEIQQLIREAVANSVRHGEAGKIWIELKMQGDNLELTCTDDGLGFSTDGLTPRPRSLSERLETMGGTLQVESQDGLTRLTLTIPVRARQ